jgi:hypothetical protein
MALVHLVCQPDDSEVKGKSQARERTKGPAWTEGAEVTTRAADGIGGRRTGTRSVAYCAASLHAQSAWNSVTPQEMRPE